MERNGRKDLVVVVRVVPVVVGLVRAVADLALRDSGRVAAWVVSVLPGGVDRIGATIVEPRIGGMIVGSPLAASLGGMIAVSPRARSPVAMTVASPLAASLGGMTVANRRERSRGATIGVRLGEVADRVDLVRSIALGVRAATGVSQGGAAVSRAAEAGDRAWIADVADSVSDGLLLRRVVVVRRGVASALVVAARASLAALASGVARVSVIAAMGHSSAAVGRVVEAHPLGVRDVALVMVPASAIVARGHSLGEVVEASAGGQASVTALVDPRLVEGVGASVAGRASVMADGAHSSAGVVVVGDAVLRLDTVGEDLAEGQPARVRPSGIMVTDPAGRDGVVTLLPGALGSVRHRDTGLAVRKVGVITGEAVRSLLASSHPAASNRPAGSPQVGHNPPPLPDQPIWKGVWTV